jgi:hypothetical protein
VGRDFRNTNLELANWSQCVLGDQLGEFDKGEFRTSDSIYRATVVSGMIRDMARCNLR